MSVSKYTELVVHVGHRINCAVYGDGENVALECEDCHEILLDFDNEEPETRLT